MLIIITKLLKRYPFTKVGHSRRLASMGEKCFKPISTFAYIRICQSEHTEDNRKVEEDDF